MGHGSGGWSPWSEREKVDVTGWAIPIYMAITPDVCRYEVEIHFRELWENCILL